MGGNELPPLNAIRNSLAKLDRAMAVLGYARVSTQDQNLSGQLEALKAAGADPVYQGKDQRCEG